MPPQRILAILEAESISGSTKGVIEFVRQIPPPGLVVPGPALSLMKFSRGPQADNILTRTLRDLQLPLHVIEEAGPYDLRVLARLRELVRQLQPDLIWSNSVKSHFLVRMSGIHRRAGWVAFHHGYTTTNLKMRVYNQMDRWSLRGADRVITVCQPFARELSAMGIPRERILVQHMPIRPFMPPEPELLSALRQRLGIGGETKVLLSVGRFSREKGHADLIHSFSSMRRMLPETPMQLVLVGEGPEQEPVRRLCQELNLDEAVTFAGQQEDVRPFYGIADLFLLPSHSEGSPNVLLEAMAAGIPVVATSVGGIPELAEPEKDALLVPSHDPEALAAASVRILQQEDLRERLTRSAREIVGQKTPDAYYTALQAVFTKAGATGTSKR